MHPLWFMRHVMSSWTSTGYDYEHDETHAGGQAKSEDAQSAQMHRMWSLHL